MDPWLLTFLVLLAYAALVILLGLTGVLQRLNIQAVGPLLIWRTGRGRQALERLARPRRLWGAFARFSVGLVFAAMAGMVALLLLQAYVLTQQRAEPVDVVKVIGIPGINPLIPLGYGIVGLALALLVHEGCHGILARVEGIRVRSMGLLVAVIPIGAFVEPDESEMRVAPLKKRLRIYAVGPASNLVVAFMCAAIFSMGFAGALEPIDDGVIVYRVVVDSPAANASLPTYSLIDDMRHENGTSFVDIHDVADFTQFMESTVPGEAVTFHYYFNKERFERTIVLDRRPDNRTNGYLGVGTTEDDYYITYARPQATIAYECGPSGNVKGPGCVAAGSFAFLGLPVAGLSPAPPELQNLYRVRGPLAGLGDGFWVLADTFYWLFWLNFMLGTFNALPLLPLDGGHIYRDAVRGFLRRRARSTPEGSAAPPAAAEPPAPAKADDFFGDIRASADPLERRAQKITYYTSLIVLMLILWSLVAPRVVPALGG